MREFKPTHFQLAEEFEKCNPLLKDAVKNTRHYYEEKIDGSRCCAIIKKGKVTQLINRRGVDVLDKYPHFKQDEFYDNFGGIDMVLDGEIYVNDDNGVARLNLLSRSGNRSRVRFMAFDILSLGDTDLRIRIFRRRRGYLQDVPLGEHFDLIPSYPKFNTIWKKVVAENREGVVAKNRKRRYIGGRNTNYIKIKNFKDIILEFNDYDVTKTGITLKSADNKTRVACNGLQSNEVRSILDKKGRVEVEMQYLFRSAEGKYYQPTFKRLVK